MARKNKTPAASAMQALWAKTAMGQKPADLPPGYDMPRPHQGGLFGEPSYRELWEWYDEAYLSKDAVADSTRESTESYVKQALAWLDAERITHPEAGDWIRYGNWRRSRECPNFITANTWNTHRKRLAAVYNFCRQVPRRGWLSVIPNPLHHSQVRPVPMGRRKPRSMAEPYITYPLLLAAMPDPRWRALISLLRWNIPRIQEALAIPLPGSGLDSGRRILDLDRGTVTIAMQRDVNGLPLSDLKTEYCARVLELAPEPLQFIREALRWKAHNDANPSREWKRTQGEAARSFVFPFFKPDLGKVMAIHREVAPQDFPEWERGEQGAGAYHVYRHTGATEMLRTGTTKEELHRILGHSDMRTTSLYVDALLVDVVGGDNLKASWEAQMQRQAQAIAERSGKGLVLVPLKKK